MNEHSFVRSVHRKIDPGVHVWKINTRFANGVADAWYSGHSGDVWIEYKYLSRVPVRRFTPPLSALQAQWLTARYKEGRNVAVVVGCPDGSVILTDGTWNEVQSPPERWLTVSEVAEWINQQTQFTSISQTPQPVRVAS